MLKEFLKYIQPKEDFSKDPVTPILKILDVPEFALCFKNWRSGSSLLYRQLYKKHRKVLRTTGGLLWMEEVFKKYLAELYAAIQSCVAFTERDFGSSQSVLLEIKRYSEMSEVGEDASNDFTELAFMLLRKHAPLHFGKMHSLIARQANLSTLLKFADQYAHCVCSFNMIMQYIQKTDEATVSSKEVYEVIKHQVITAGQPLSNVIIMLGRAKSLDEALRMKTVEYYIIDQIQFILSHPLLGVPMSKKAQPVEEKGVVESIALQAKQKSSSLINPKELARWQSNIKDFQKLCGKKVFSEKHYKKLEAMAHALVPDIGRQADWFHKRSTSDECIIRFIEHFLVNSHRFAQPEEMFRLLDCLSESNQTIYIPAVLSELIKLHSKEARYRLIKISLKDNKVDDFPTLADEYYQLLSISPKGKLGKQVHELVPSFSSKHEQLNRPKEINIGLALEAFQFFKPRLSQAFFMGQLRDYLDRSLKVLPIEQFSPLLFKLVDMLPSDELKALYYDEAITRSRALKPEGVLLLKEEFFQVVKKTYQKKKLSLEEKNLIFTFLKHTTLASEDKVLLYGKLPPYTQKKLIGFLKNKKKQAATKKESLHTSKDVSRVTFWGNFSSYLGYSESKLVTHKAVP